MFETYKETNIYYKIKGKGDRTLVFLHGWGMSHECFEYFTDYFQDFYTCICVDFPPFGNSEEPKNPWTLDDYVVALCQILKNFKFENVSIIAHSFGGRVAIKLASCYPEKVKCLLLTGCAGMKPRRGLSYYFKVYGYKLFRFKSAGSADYKVLSPVMKKTFSYIVNTFQEKQAKQIVCPTLLIFGKKDKQTKMYMAKRLNKLIKNSKLIVFDDCSHFCFLEQKEKFLDFAIDFLKEN